MWAPAADGRPIKSFSTKNPANRRGLSCRDENGISGRPAPRSCSPHCNRGGSARQLAAVGTH